MKKKIKVSIFTGNRAEYGLLSPIIRKISKSKKINENVIISGSHLGIAIDIAAYALGANYIERHFTLDRTWKGTDHAASLEPAGLTKLVRDLENTAKTMHEKKEMSKS